MMGGLGTGRRMLRLTAQYADIWNLVAQFDPAETDRYAFYQSRHALLDAACEMAGRDPATLTRSVVDNVNSLNHPGYMTAQGIPVLRGSPADIAEAFARYRDLGVEHLIVNPLPLSVEAVEAMAPVLEVLGRGEA